MAPVNLGGGLPCLSSALWCQYPSLLPISPCKILCRLGPSPIDREEYSPLDLTVRIAEGFFAEQIATDSVRYWHQRADERHGDPPQGNQELLVVRDRIGRPLGELGVSKLAGVY